MFKFSRRFSSYSFIVRWKSMEKFVFWTLRVDERSPSEDLWLNNMNTFTEYQRDSIGRHSTDESKWDLVLWGILLSFCLVIGNGTTEIVMTRAIQSFIHFVRHAIDCSNSSARDTRSQETWNFYLQTNQHRRGITLSWNYPSSETSAIPLLIHRHSNVGLFSRLISNCQRMTTGHCPEYGCVQSPDTWNRDRCQTKKEKIS